MRKYILLEVDERLYKKILDLSSKYNINESELIISILEHYLKRV